MYAPDREQDLRWMRRALDLAALCPPAAGAYSVGAVIVGEDGTELAAGYSREADPREHAEEAALRKLSAEEPRLLGATIYSTLEPCSQRSAARTPCARRIVDAGIPRVVMAWREPALFVDDCVGYEQLVEAGVVVVELRELAAAAREVNSHLGGLA
ncbi:MULTISPECIES: deaminase [unclassified Streptomyces]|uniref:deaminase n=1 Tax=unclassified Streptomyces TaxID=2593676 RepID=UPI00081D7174|nr:MULTISPECIES: deaminase [unclassified Streptomyces]MYR27811.1 dCMP deaminase [Streptomyces sp. SID4945]SCF29650.1 diaminohydroxyphosphoribosylaminopyrimidine deaminase [Streptomyces sp. LcepLS]